MSLFFIMVRIGEAVARVRDAFFWLEDKVNTALTDLFDGE